MFLKVRQLLQTSYLIILTMILNRHAIRAALSEQSLLPSMRQSSSTRRAPLAFTSLSKSRPDNNPDVQRLVLIGGGHAHVQVIKALNKASRPDNMKVTLIDVQASASYSGMVPGTISGLYKPEDTLLHLKPLADWAGIEFINKKVVDMDFDNNLIYVGDDFDNPIAFDAVSIDIGSTSLGIHEIKGAQKYTIPTRPIAKLVAKLQEESEELQKRPRPVDVVVIGAGAAGTELAMSIRARWVPIVGAENIRVTVLDAGDMLLPWDTEANRDALRRILEERCIHVRHGCTVDKVMEQSLRLTSGEEIPFTHCLWATGAGAHDLAYRLGNRGLAISKDGWIRVNENLQSVSHPNVFAAGDCCTMESPGRRSPPKAGVYAVRSGPILIENLTRALDQDKTKPLTPYKPQDDFLRLMVCGDGKALGFRFGIPIQGKWVFDLKNEIDTGFMALFQKQNLPKLKKGQSYDTSQYDDDSKKKRPEPLAPPEAAELLQRTDDDVDFQLAWSILRRMTADEDYRRQVLEHIPAATPSLVVA